VAVREATAQVEPATATLVQVFSAGTVHQVFPLAGHVEGDGRGGVGQSFGDEQGGAAMLVLTRKAQEVVVVGAPDTPQPLLTITVLEVVGDKVRLGFQADASVPVHRWEVWQRIHRNGQPGGPRHGRGPPGAKLTPRARP
jgi:carbon storage regulator